MQARIRGGERLTDAKALTVMPRSRPESSRVVKTVTDEANRPRTERKRSGSIKGTGTGNRESKLDQTERRKYVSRIHDFARRHEISGYSDQEVREVFPTRERRSGAVDQER